MKTADAQTSERPLCAIIELAGNALPRGGPGEILAPDEYQRSEDARMAASAAINELVQQTAALSNLLGMAIEGNILRDDPAPANCAYLLQSNLDAIIALREVEIRASAALRWSDQVGRQPEQEQAT